MLVVILDSCIYKNANTFISVTLHKSQHQVEKGPQHKTRYTGPNRRERGDRLVLIDTGKNFMKSTPVATSLKQTLIKMGPHEAEKLLFGKGHTIIQAKQQSTD